MRTRYKNAAYENTYNFFALGFKIKPSVALSTYSTDVVAHSKTRYSNPPILTHENDQQTVF